MRVHAPIRCQILGRFQATYIKLRGNRASKHWRMFSLFECECLSGLHARVKGRNGNKAVGNGYRETESSTNLICLVMFDVPTRRNKPRAPIEQDVDVLYSSNHSPPFWLLGNWPWPQRTNSVKDGHSQGVTLHNTTVQLITLHVLHWASAPEWVFTTLCAAFVLCQCCQELPWFLTVSSYAFIYDVLLCGLIFLLFFALRIDLIIKKWA